MTEFKDATDTKACADSWVAARLPGEHVVRLLAEERNHFATFNEEYGRFVSQFEVEYSAFVELVDQVNFLGRTAWPPHRAIQYVLVAYNAKTFQSAFDRLVRGYYEDGITLTRGLYETFVRLLFVSCHPDDAYSVLAFKPPAGVRRFNLTNFLEHDLGLEWETKYGVMSAFAHSSSFLTLAALERALKREGEPERFGARLEFKQELAEAAIPFLQFALLTHLRVVVERLVGDGVAMDPEALVTASEAIDLLTFGLRHHPKPYWRGVASDLDQIFLMLDVADRGEDWAAFLNAERSRPDNATHNDEPGEPNDD